MLRTALANYATQLTWPSMHLRLEQMHILREFARTRNRTGHACWFGLGTMSKFMGLSIDGLPTQVEGISGGCDNSGDKQYRSAKLIPVRNVCEDEAH